MKTNVDMKTIKVQVIFFASFSDFMNTNKLDINIKQDESIKGLQELLFNKLSPNKQWKKPLLYAVNQAYATLDTKLSEGDEVVFMPFVSGG